MITNVNDNNDTVIKSYRIDLLHAKYPKITVFLIRLYNLDIIFLKTNILGRINWMTEHDFY